MPNLILIGFMGSGKDCIGKELARRTGLTFCSTDEMIELAENRTINDIFERNGEPYFRRLEKKILSAIKDLKNVIIATGGGMVLDLQNQKKLAQMGLVVHLIVDAATIRQRLQDDSSRPLLKQPGALEKLLADRRGIYDFARIKLNTIDKSPAQIAAELLAQIDFPESKKISLKPRQVKVQTPSSTYNVIIGAGLLGELHNYLPYQPRRCAIISNPLVATLFLKQLKNALKAAGMDWLPIIIPDGEHHKNIKTISRIYDTLLDHHLDRSDLIIGLGGGIITDIAGFVAATLKRGCRLIQVPTTLLAQVDASVGGKTGVNHQLGKNLIGSFYQPDLVGADVNLLNSLPEREFRNGLAEVIKIAVIRDVNLFNLLEEQRHRILARDPKLLVRIVERCVQLKRAIVQADERELGGLRALLNFGHTLGHLYETAGQYRQLKHGEAIAIGMAQEIRISRIVNSLSESDSRRIVDLIAAYGLPISKPGRLAAGQHLSILRQDKKARDSKLMLPLIQSIGTSNIKELEWTQFESFMARI
jgi:shikimate kinase/3-dehydroquinate synthase